MVDGKARLMRDDYCDGLGDCLPHCPTNAITFIEREAVAYDEEDVKKHMAAQGRVYRGRCPGSQARRLEPAETVPASTPDMPSRLSQWPVQLKLVPPHAPYFNGASLLIAADCTAYAYENFHADFIRGRVTLIGCPKLDTADYEEKLTAILTENDVRSVMLTRMEVPCCGGLEYAARQAIAHSGRALPLRVVTISAEGRILQEQTT